MHLPPQLAQLLGNPWFWSLLFAYWVSMAFIGGMPPPDASSSKGYRWAYGSLHIFSANLKSAFGKFTAGSPPDDQSKGASA